jgi:predicted ribosomally synthesized peptide with nif11-like leader
MSRVELDRLLDDARKSGHLLEELRSRLHDVDEALRWAHEHGYALRPEDVCELRDSGQELDDDELDKVAGGDDAWGSGSTTGGTTPGGGG